MQIRDADVDQNPRLPSRCLFLLAGSLANVLVPLVGRHHLFLCLGPRRSRRGVLAVEQYCNLLQSRALSLDEEKEDYQALNDQPKSNKTS